MNLSITPIITAPVVRAHGIRRPSSPSKAAMAKKVMFEALQVVGITVCFAALERVNDAITEMFASINLLTPFGHLLLVFEIMWWVLTVACIVLNVVVLGGNVLVRVSTYRELHRNRTMKYRLR